MKLDKALHIIDTISGMAASMAKWLLPACLAVVFYDVVVRYVFHHATIWAYDMAYFFYAGNFLLAGACVLRDHSHIRVDVFFNLLSRRGQAIAEVCFFLLLIIPTMIMMTYAGTEFAIDSWMSWEKSMFSVWHPPVYPIKTFIPIAFILLLLQSIAEFIRNVMVVVKGDKEE